MNNTLLTAASLAILTSFSQAALVDGLVNYWTFDGDAIDHAHGVPGSASTVADNGSFGGANGTGGIGYVAGLKGSAIALDGAADAAQDNGHVIIPRSGDTLYGATTAHTPNTLTTSLWVTIGGDDTGWQTALSHGEGSQYRVAMRGNSNVPGYAGGSGEGPDNGPDITGGDWHNIIAISDGAAGNTRLYVDGLLTSIGGAPNIDDARGASSLDFFIGANPDTGAQTREWFGNIDDVAQWNRVLTEDEITSIAGGADIIPIPEPSTSLLAALAGLGLLSRRRR
jgi:hypothetical protein